MRPNCLTLLFRGCLSLLLLIPHGTTSSVLYGQPVDPVKASFSLEYIPRDAVAVFAAKPAELLKSDILSPSREAIDEAVTTSLGTTLKADDIVEAMVILVPTQTHVSPAFIMRLSSPQAASELTSTFGTRGPRTSFGGRPYDTWSSRIFSFQPDDTTIIFSPDEPTLRRCIAAGASGASSTKWAAKWETVAGRDAAVVVNTSLLRGQPGPAARMLQQLPRKQFTGDLADPHFNSQLSPLWLRSEYIVADLSLSQTVELTAVSQSASIDEAKWVHSALLTAVSIGRAALSRARASIARRADDSAFALMQSVDLSDEILEKAHVVQRDNQVGFLVRADHEAAQRLAKLAAPAALAARTASLRSRSSNNLKQIALAFHNYHDTYNRFPAATQIGPKNIPHSWRVTLLPYLEQAPLYEQYRQDEPWDSEHNRQLLAKIPEVFRCPLDDANSTSTSYLAFVGSEDKHPSPLFVGTASPRFAEVRDGTSNTILVVETKGESVPWTKPEDIPFAPDAPLLKLGDWYPGGFNVAMCDGSTRFLPEQIDEETLRRAIMRDDGNPVSLP